MSQIRNQSIISMKSADTSAPAYRIVTFATTLANSVQVWETAASLMVGASANEGSATGFAWSIVIGGTCKLMAGENLSQGAQITAQTDTGKAMHAVKDFATGTTQIPRSFGMTLEGISVGAIGEVLIQINNLYISATAA